MCVKGTSGIEFYKAISRKSFLSKVVADKQMNNFVLSTPAQNLNNSSKSEYKVLAPSKYLKSNNFIQFFNLSCMTWDYLEVRLGIYSFRKITFPKDPYNLDLQQLLGIVASLKIFRTFKKSKITDSLSKLQNIRIIRCSSTKRSPS